MQVMSYSGMQLESVLPHCVRLGVLSPPLSFVYNFNVFNVYYNIYL